MTLQKTRIATPRNKVLFLTCTALVAAAVPVGCAEEFTSCEDTLTCKDDDGGEGGTAGDGGRGSGSGMPGIIDGGSAGDSNEPALEVIDITPEDGATNVDRAPTISVRFSEALAVDSVTDDSVVLDGPEGRIAIESEVEGSELTISATNPLSLLGQYRLVLSASLEGETGSTPSAPVTQTFRVRDGIWGAAQRLDTSATGVNVRRSGAGHFLAAWSTEGEGLVKAIVYEPSIGWTAPRVLDGEPGQTIDFSVSINRTGAAIVGWSRLPPDLGGFARFDPASGWADKVADDTNREIAVSTNGSVVSVWDDRTGTSDLLYSVLQANGRTWGPAATLRPDAVVAGLVSLSDHVLLVHSIGDTAGYWGARFDGAWSPSESLTDSLGADTFRVNVTAHGEAILTGTLQGSEECAWVKVVDGSGEPPVQLDSGLDCGYAETAINEDGRGIAGWLSSGSARAAVRFPDGSWSEAEDLGPAAEQSSWAPNPGIDAQGNGVVVWHANGSLLFRRWIEGEGWQALAMLPLGSAQGPYVVTQSSGDTTVLWTNGSGLWTAQFE